MHEKILLLKKILSACFGSTYTKIGTIQRRLAWPLCKDDTQIREAFHIFRPRGIGWRGRWEGGLGLGTHVNPWLFHFNV